MRITSIVISMFVAVALAACSSNPAKKAETDSNQKTVASQENKSAESQRAQQTNTATVETAISSVYFDFDKFNLKPEERAAIEQEASWMKSHKGQKVTLEGNTDDRGSAEYNLALGSRRAKTVHEALKVLGVDSSRITDTSYGEAHPKASCEEESCWKQNRRVDFANIDK